MADPTPLSPTSLWHNSTTDRISFNENSSEIIRIDQRGFHYKGQFIEDAGDAHRVFVEFLRKHQPDQQRGAEHDDTTLSPAAQAVLDAANKAYWRWDLMHPADADAIAAAALRAAADQVAPEGFAYDSGSLADGALEFEQGQDCRNEVIRSGLLAIAAELEGAND